MRSYLLIILFFSCFLTSLFAQSQADTSRGVKEKVKSKIDTVYKKIGNSDVIQKYKASLKNLREKISGKYKTMDSLVKDTTKVRDKIKNIITEINKSEKTDRKKDTLTAGTKPEKITPKNNKDTLTPGASNETIPFVGKENIADNYVKVGTLYLEINKPSEAVSYYEKGLLAARAARSPDITQNALKGLYDAYTKKLDLKKALFYYQAYTELKDSLYAYRAEQFINILQAENEIQLLQVEKQKRETDFQISNATLEKQKQIILTSIIILVLICVLALALFGRYKEKKKNNDTLLTQNKQINDQKKELEELQKVLKDDLDHYMQLALRKQMNPHFIFNSLNSIQSFIMQNDKLSANIYLSKFAGLMRKVLENSRHQSISLNTELEVLKLYIELEEQRFDKKFICKWDIEENIDLSAHQVPPLIFQPYVENAIWHGLLHKDGEKILTISIKRKENQLLCGIQDNGIGREAASNITKDKIKHESLGAKITQKRIQLINSLNKTGIAVQFHDLYGNDQKANGTRVELIIPISEMSILED